MERHAVIVAGFGFRAGTGLAALREVLALAQEGHPPVTLLVTAQEKAGALFPLAEALGLPVTGISSEAMAAAPTVTCSTASLAARHVGSVAEASAMAAAGAGACLLAPRHISSDRMATCAIAASVTLQGAPI